MKIAIIDDFVDDAHIIFQHLHTYFSKHCTNMPLSIQIFQSGEDFLLGFHKNSFDIIFVDYYLNQLTGLETSFAIRKLDGQVTIIFTTSSRDYIIEGYKVQASGYLIKPISYEAFSEILSFIDLHEIKEQSFIEVVSGYENMKILLNDIVHCDISGHYVQIHMKNLNVLRCRMTFNKLSDMLLPYSQFLLCCRGCIINMDHIDHLENLIFFMDTGERIPLRKRQNDETLKLYSEYLFDKVRNQKV